MIEQQGRVIAVKDGLVDVQLGGTTGCANCDAGKGCGAGVFGRLLKRKPVTVSLENTVEAKRDQPVIVGIPETLFIRLVARIYLYPLLAGITGASFGYYFSTLADFGPVSTDMITLVSGLLTGFSVLFWSRMGPREFSGSFIVHLLRVIDFPETRE